MFRTVRPQRGASIPPLRRRTFGSIAAVTMGAMVLTGCAAGMIAQSVDQVANIDGAQGTIQQVGVHNALLATPSGPDYPKGSQAPLTMMISNDAPDPDTLTAITTDAGTVKIEGKATVGPDALLKIGPDSKVTATITDLTRDLKYGISIPMTFSFANAGNLSLNVPIEIPAERTPRPTLDIWQHEPPELWESTQSTPTNATSPAASGHPTAAGQTTEGPTTTPGPTTGYFYTRSSG